MQNVLQFAHEGLDSSHWGSQSKLCEGVAQQGWGSAGGGGTGDGTNLDATPLAIAAAKPRLAMRFAASHHFGMFAAILAVFLWRCSWIWTLQDTGWCSVLTSLPNAVGV
jgi:hypothetical protein